MLNLIENTPAPDAKLKRLPALTPFSATAVRHFDPRHPERSETSKTYRTAVANFHYIPRTLGADHLGRIPDGYMAKTGDLVATGRRYPQTAPLHLQHGVQLWAAADAATVANLAYPAAWHLVLRLHDDGGPEEWQRLVEEWIDRHLVTIGVISDWALHSQTDANGEWTTRPHCHVLATVRRWKAHQQEGRPIADWLFNEAHRKILEDRWLAAAKIARTPFTLD